MHAAWADGSCWANIILPLERRGLHVMCAPIPMTSLTDQFLFSRAGQGRLHDRLPISGKRSLCVRHRRGSERHHARWTRCHCLCTRFKRRILQQYNHHDPSGGGDLLCQYQYYLWRFLRRQRNLPDHLLIEVDSWYFSKAESIARHIAPLPSTVWLLRPSPECRARCGGFAEESSGIPSAW